MTRPADGRDAEDREQTDPADRLAAINDELVARGAPPFIHPDHVAALDEHVLNRMVVAASEHLASLIEAEQEAR